MEVEGKFTLLNLNEFQNWLSSQHITRRIDKVQQHHTWMPNYSSFSGKNHFRLLKGMRNSHLERGFNDIAQNFTTFPDGTIGTGRSLNIIPAGIKGANTGGICIEHVGNFDQNKDVINNTHSKTIIAITAILLKYFGLQPNTDNIIYHHWYDLNTGERRNGSGTTKSCPGTNFFGGNKVNDCENNFLPLINAELESISINSYIESNQIIKVGRVIVDNTDDLKVRTGPSSQNPIIDVLNNGIEVNCYEIVNKWWRVHPNEQRWSYSKFIDEI